MWQGIAFMVAFALVLIVFVVDVVMQILKWGDRPEPTTEAEWREHIVRQYRDRE